MRICNPTRAALLLCLLLPHSAMAQTHREEAQEPKSLFRIMIMPDRPTQKATESIRKILKPAAYIVDHTDRASRRIIWFEADQRELSLLTPRLKADPDVLWLEEYQPKVPDNQTTSWLIQSTTEEAGQTVWHHGLTGLGQIVGVADTGLDIDACQFRFSADADAITPAISEPQPPEAEVQNPANKVISYYVIGSADAYDHVTSGYHGTHTAGTAAGDDYTHLASEQTAILDLHDGMAPSAQIVFQDVGTNEGYLSGLSGVSTYDLLQQAYDTGVRVHSNSYGNISVSLAYDFESESIDEAMWRLNDLLVLFSAGNLGEENEPNGSLNGTGAIAKNTLVVGASGPVEFDLFGSLFHLRQDLLFFSSRGPTQDGRIKPDLVAPGMVFSATTNPDTTIDLGCCDKEGNQILNSNEEDDNCNVDTEWPAFGTSFSTPATAGAAVLARQYYVDGFWFSGESNAERGFNPTNSLIKATLINGATPLTGEIFLGTRNVTSLPSFDQGWGRVNLEDALYFEGDDRHSLLLDDVPNQVPGNPMLQPILSNDGLQAYPGRGAPLSTGDERSWLLPQAKNDQLLKITLAWSDPPAEVGANPTLVNDLNLEVLGPEGEVYAGNLGFNSQSTSEPVQTDERDELNNVECVSSDYFRKVGTGQRAPRQPNPGLLPGSQRSLSSSDT